MYSWQAFWIGLNWFLLTFTLLVLLAALLWSLAPVGRYIVDSWHERRHRGDILARRIARGEISRRECDRRLRAVRRARQEAMVRQQNHSADSDQVAQSS